MILEHAHQWGLLFLFPNTQILPDKKSLACMHTQYSSLERFGWQQVFPSQTRTSIFRKWFEDASHWWECSCWTSFPTSFFLPEVATFRTSIIEETISRCFEISFAAALWSCDWDIIRWVPWYLYILVPILQTLRFRTLKHRVTFELLSWGTILFLALDSFVTKFGHFSQLVYSCGLWTWGSKFVPTNYCKLDTEIIFSVLQAKCVPASVLSSDYDCRKSLCCW